MTDPTPPLDEYLSVLPDRLIVRFNELMTTVLDVIGALALSFAVGWIIWGAPWRQPLAVAVTGILIVALSNIAQHRAALRPLPEAVQSEPIPLPGPADAGTIHFAGR